MRTEVSRLKSAAAGPVSVHVQRLQGVTAGVQCQHSPPHRQLVPMLAVLHKEQALHIDPAAGFNAGECCRRPGRPLHIGAALMIVIAASACSRPLLSLAAAPDASHQPTASQPLHACSQHCWPLLRPCGASQLLPTLSSALPASQLLTEAQPPGACPQHCSPLSTAAGTSSLLAAAASSPSPFRQRGAICLTAADSSQRTGPLTEP